MNCDICGEEAKTWGHCVCLECYITPKAKDKQLAIYKRALELACEDNKRAYELQYLRNDINIGSVDAFKNEYLRKAKEELKEV